MLPHHPHLVFVDVFDLLEGRTDPLTKRSLEVRELHDRDRSANAPADGASAATRTVYTLLGSGAAGAPAGAAARVPIWATWSSIFPSLSPRLRSRRSVSRMVVKEIISVPTTPARAASDMGSKSRRPRGGSGDRMDRCSSVSCFMKTSLPGVVPDTSQSPMA